MKLKSNLLLLVSLSVLELGFYYAPTAALDRPDSESPVLHSSQSDAGRDVAGTAYAQTVQNSGNKQLQAQIDQLETQLRQIQRQLERPNESQSLARNTPSAVPRLRSSSYTRDERGESVVFAQQPANTTTTVDTTSQAAPVNFFRAQSSHYALPLPHDYMLNFFGNVQFDFFTGTALELFSADDLDNYMFIQDALDVGFNINKPNGDARYELLADLRTKGVFGNSGVFDQTLPRAIKIGLGRTEADYSFKPNLQNVWLRELWFKYNINPAYHTDFQIGFFPFSIGAGLSLGNAYKVGKLIPGFYEERFVDQFRPGVLLSGDIWNDRLFYSLYGAITINEGSNFWDTGAFSNAQDPNMRNHPSRGRFVKDMIGAAEISYRTQRNGIDCDVRPYLVIDHDQAQQVEFPDDATSFLGILGINIQAQKGQWSLFFESAMNFGSQYVKSWDRDQVQFVSGPQHTYLFQDFADKPGVDTPVWKVARRTPCPEDASFYRGNGTEFLDATGYHYKNAFDRFRKAYYNTYHGVMVYAETAYRHAHPFKLDTELTIALGAGFASGDTPPNDSAENLLANRLNGKCKCCDKGDCHAYVPFSDFNKDYCGFTGIGQMFINRDVYSVFLLESEKLNQPLSARESRLTYPQFTNLMFVGLGTTYEQLITNERAFKIRFNLLSYWQPWQSLKGYNYGLDTLFALSSCGQIATTTYVPGLTADANTQLGHHLGVEVNSTLNFKFDDHLDLYVAAAAFLPGTYYDAAYGKFIPLAAQYQLASVDFSGYEMNPHKYDIALGDNTAFILNIGMGYSFDTAPKARAVFSPEFTAQVSQLDRVVTAAPAPVKLTARTTSQIITVPTPTAKLSAEELLLLNVLETPASSGSIGAPTQPVHNLRTAPATAPVIIPTLTPAAAHQLAHAEQAQTSASLTAQLQVLTPVSPAPSRHTLSTPAALPVLTPAITPALAQQLAYAELAHHGTQLAQQLAVLTPVTVSLSRPTLALPAPTTVALFAVPTMPAQLSQGDLQLLNILEYQAPVSRPVRLALPVNSVLLTVPTPAALAAAPQLVSLNPSDLAILEHDFTQAQSIRPQLNSVPKVTA